MNVQQMAPTTRVRRRELEHLAVHLGDVATFLVFPEVQSGNTAREALVQATEPTYETLWELVYAAVFDEDPLANTVEPEDDPEGYVSVDRTALGMLAFMLLHAQRCHHDGRKTVTDEEPYEMLAVGAGVLGHVAGIRGQSDRNEIRQRMEREARLASLLSGRDADPE